MKGRVNKTVTIFLTAALLFTCFACSLQVVHAAEQESEQKTVRVGYMDYDGFIDEQSDGTFSGYAAEYLAKISEYTGYHYEYVFGEWSDLLVKLKNKEIDFLCSAQYTAERAEDFEFSAYPIGYTQGLLYTLPENKELSYEDYRLFNGMKTGVIKDSAMAGIFEQYSERHEFSCDMVEYDTETEMLSALHSGEIEAMCGEHLANHKGLSLLAKFGADAYYIISYKGNPYMQSLNFALQEIKSDVNYEAELFHKYYDDSTAATSLQFTTAEREYIAQSAPITVAMNTNRVPFSEYDKATDTYSGICADVMAQISEKSGLTFVYGPQEPGKTTPEILKSGKYDMVCGVERDNFSANETIDASVAFLESEIVPVGKTGANIDLSGNITAAIPSSYQALRKRMEKEHPNLTLIYYNSNQECLSAVLSEEADISVHNTHLLSCLLQEPKYEGLDILPLRIMTEHTAIAIPRSADPRLLSIINKSISNIDEAAISSSLIKYTFANPYKYTLFDFLYKFRVQVIIIVLLSAICFMLLFRVAVVRKHNEEKLQKQNALLADAVAQADRASVAKSQFLSRMSHEIRTPMNAIVGLTEIAKQHETDPSKVDNYLNKIEVSSKVLLNIINDVLDMSAIEGNKLKIASEEFDIKQILTGINTIYYPQCEAKGIQFAMETDLKNEILIGDSLRLNQILLNLVSNAYKFTENNGKISLIAKETTQKEDIVFVQFIVSDNGCGMTPDMLERIFKPFEQETADTAQKHGGSGLGLSIAKNLVDIMHGAIKVESEKGKGTVFFVDLPFKIAQGRKMSSESLKSVRVLVVDDNREARKYTSIVLNRVGVQFDVAASGKEALDKISEANANNDFYEVCLVDWKMDGMDGIELTRHIREIEKKHTLIVIVSAYDLNGAEEQAKTAGADQFITKPLFQSTVFNMLMSLGNGVLKNETAELEAYDFKGYRALLAEDNEINAEIAVELLEMVNLEVDRVRNGEEAVEKFRQSEPGTYALVLLDVQMPVMNGYEAARELRRLDHPDAGKIPIYALTANAFTEDVSATLSAGMNGHIAKPIDTAILYETIKKAIEEKNSSPNMT